MRVRVAAPGGLGLPTDPGRSCHGPGVGATDRGECSFWVRPVDLLVDAILDSVQRPAPHRGPAPVRTPAISAEGRLERLCAAAKMLVTVAEGGGWRTSRRCCSARRPRSDLLSDWDLPRRGPRRLHSSPGWDRGRARLRSPATFPPERLVTLTSRPAGVPVGRRASEGDSFRRSPTRSGRAVRQPRPSRCSQPMTWRTSAGGIVDTCLQNVLLKRSANLVPRAGRSRGRRGARPRFSIEDLEGVVAEALGRGGFSPRACSQASVRCHAERAADLQPSALIWIARLRRKVADRAHITQLAGLVRQLAPQRSPTTSRFPTAPSCPRRGWGPAALLPTSPTAHAGTCPREVLPASASGDPRPCGPGSASPALVPANLLYILGKVRQASPFLVRRARLPFAGAGVEAPSRRRRSGSAARLSRCAHKPRS